MPEDNPNAKKAEQQLTDALADFAQTDAGTPEREHAKDERAKAEQQIADARNAKKDQGA